METKIIFQRNGEVKIFEDRQELDTYLHSQQTNTNPATKIKFDQQDLREKEQTRRDWLKKGIWGK